jgi:hypothetical protein
MPVQAQIDAHVEADQNDALRAELRCDVDRLKSRVAAVADHARFVEQHAIDVALDFQEMHVGISCGRFDR